MVVPLIDISLRTATLHLVDVKLDIGGAPDLSPKSGVTWKLQRIASPRKLSNGALKSLDQSRI